MTGQQHEPLAAGTRRVEQFFMRLGVVLTSLLVTAALVNVGSYFVLRRIQSAEARRLEERQAALIAQLGRPRGASVGPRIPLWNMMSASPAYDSFPWAEEFWREERARLTRFRKACYAPHRLWANCGPHRGKHVNIGDDGFRVSPDPLGPEGDGEAFTIFVLGGSMAYGWGSPDSETITAHLAALVRERLQKSSSSAPQREVRVVNLGVPAYNSAQELLLLIELLKQGQRPDLVISYGGANDATVEPGLHWDFLNIKSKLEGGDSPASPAADLLRATSTFRLASLLRSRLTGSESDTRGPVGRPLSAETTNEALRERASRVLDEWLASRDLVAALARDYSFRHLFVWQPSFFYGHKPPSRGERVMSDNPELFFINNLDAAAARAFAAGVRAAYEEAGRRAQREDFLFLGGIFDHTPEPTYIDWVHTGPLGNRIVASRIVEHLEANKYPPFADAP